MNRAFVTVGLGFGDEGKGALVDFLVHRQRATLVVRYSGGCQCAHNVALADGRSHVFAQFGAGSFSGAATYLDEHVIIDPPALRHERTALLPKVGFEPFGRLFIHPRCLVVSPYLRHLNRLRELARGANRHGSCGRGIGETRSLSLTNPKASIIAECLRNTGELLGRLEAQQAFALEVAAELGMLGTPEAFNLQESPRDVAERLALDPTVRLCDGSILQQHETVVFEGAQGVLLDESHGFHPHTTWSTVTERHVRELIAAHAPSAEMTTIGVTRIFPTRHGAGPLPTADDALATALHDPGNPHNAWQGSIRAGWPDLNLWRYALSRVRVDGVFVSHLDQFAALPARKLCTSYAEPLPAAWLQPSSECDLALQETLGTYLASATPCYQSTTAGVAIEHLAALSPILGYAEGPRREDRRWL